MALTQGKSPMIHNVDPRDVKSESIDLRIGSKVNRIKAATAPNSGEDVSDIIRDFRSYDFDVRPEGSVLECNAPYLIPLVPHLCLSDRFFGSFSGKSSSAREALSALTFGNGYNAYDRIPKGYHGPLFAEIIPLCFNTLIHPGVDLVQMRVKTESEPLRPEQLLISHSKHGIVRDGNGNVLPGSQVDVSGNGIYFHVDLRRPVVGFESRGNPTEMVEMNAKGSLKWDHFWRRITAEDCKGGQLVLERDKFYLLTSIERIVVPPDICGELTDYETNAGDFRSQYARFFDRNFGAEAGGTHIVLEVRARDTHRRICHGQRICNMMFEPADKASTSYGQEMGSNYTTPHPCLAKHYEGFDKAWVEL